MSKRLRFLLIMHQFKRKNRQHFFLFYRVWCKLATKNSTVEGLKRAPQTKVIMQGKLFKRSTHLLYCSVLSLGGNVHTRRMSKLDIGSIFHMKNEIFWSCGNYYGNYQNYQNVMLLTSSDTKRTLLHLFLFTNSAQRELVSLCTQSIRNCN